MARLFDLQETKGNFQIKGKVSGVKKDDFYKDKLTRTGRPRREVKFRANYNADGGLMVTLGGMERDSVYFSKRENGKSETVKVDWADRFNFNKDGYRLIGCNIGVAKKIDENGNSVNDKKMLTEFDACKEIAQNLKDDADVYIRGRIDYSSFVDDKGTKRASIKLEPNQVSLCAPIDFDASDFEQTNDFNQVIIFMGIEKEKDDNGKETGRAVVLSKIVTYNNIEDVEFIIENQKLASKFKKTLKPYNAIKVSGHIVSSIQTETVEDDDEWGESDKMERVSAPYKREFIITGAKGSSVDKDTYTEKNVDEALAAIANVNKAESDFGATGDNWGDVSDIDDDEDEAW